MADHKTSFNPNRYQKAFIESKAAADLFSSRLGEGKSTALAWSAFYHTRHNPGARWLIARDTWENLEKSTQKTFFEWFPPGVYGTYHHTKKTFTWAPGIAKGEVIFLGLDEPKDAGKIMSVELGGIGLDEPAPAITSAGIDELIFDMGMRRLRQPGMKWYAMKLAENNPDESHWTFKKFVVPGTDYTNAETGQRVYFRLHQPEAPENLHNLPGGYYEDARKQWAHRPDLVRRFVDGEFGFQQIGQQVTPQWEDKRHLAIGLTPQKGAPLTLCWDFGHNPTCIFTQKTPLGHWLILDAVVGEGIGVEELINDEVKPLLASRFPKMSLSHIGDPAGRQREQTSIHRSAVLLLQRELGGTWRAGPVRFRERVEPLRAALHRGVVRVDRDRAAAVWHALRGGWHFHVTRTGVPTLEPVKNIHSHPGDALSYGAAVLFPLGRMGGTLEAQKEGRPSYFDGTRPLGFEKPGLIVPPHGAVLKGLG